MPKITRKGQKRKADKLFADAIKSRDGGRCVSCGSYDVPQCAHLVSRRYLNVRWDMGNAVTLCRKHHMYFTHHPLEWEVWVSDRIGAIAYQDLKNRAMCIRRVDYEAVLEALAG